MHSYQETDNVNPRLDGLTGIRAIAAAWVVLLHLNMVFSSAFSAPNWVQPLLESGNLGVDIFFILSGFVLAYNYANKMQKTTRSDIFRFYGLRVARIYPAHMVVFLAFVAVAVVAAAAGVQMGQGDVYTPLNFVMNTFMLQAVPPGQAWNPPSWSISTEFAAYLAFPFLIKGLMRIRVRTALVLMAALLLVGAVSLSIVVESATSWPYWSGYVIMWIRIVACFPIGCLLYIVWASKPREYWARRADLFLAIGLVGFVASVYLTPRDAILFIPTASYPFLVLLLLAVASGGIGARILSSRVLVWGGKVSYSVYLVHFLIILLASKAAEMLGGMPIPAPLVGPAVLVVVVGAGAVLYHFVEEPARGVIARRIRRTASVPPDGRTQQPA